MNTIACASSWLEAARLTWRGPLALQALAARRPSRLQIGLWAALMLGFLVLALRGYSDMQIGAINDDAAYVLLARSLVRGERYGLINVPGEPQHTKYPFVYPMALAALAALRPNDLEILRLPALLATLGTGALLFWGWPWFSRRRSYWWALGVTGLCLWSPMVVGHSVLVMSDSLFVLLCLAVLFLVERACRTRPGLGLGVAIGAALTGAIFCRSVGVLLLPGVAGALWLAHGRRAVRLLAVAGAAVAAVTTTVVAATNVQWASLSQSVFSYSNEFNTSVQNEISRSQEYEDAPYWEFWGVRLHGHVRDDLRGLLIPLGGGQREEAFFARLGIPSPMPVAAYLLLAVIVFGMGVWAAQEGATAAWLFAVAYGVLLVFWNWRGQRLLYPIFPQIVFVVLLAAEAVVGWARSRWPGVVRVRAHYAVAALAAGLLAMNAVVSLRPNDSLQHVGDLTERTAWVRANTPASAILLTEEPLIDYLYSGRLTLTVPNRVNDAARLTQILGNTSADYLLLAPKVEWGEQPALEYSRRQQAYLDFLSEAVTAGRIRLVYTSDNGLVRVYANLNK